MADVARLQARFVNRAKGTGTRLLLEELLAQAGLPGYQPDHCGEVATMKRLLPWWT